MQVNKSLAIALDKSLIAAKPNYIRQTLRGSELTALKGAREIIETEKPNLAICEYRKPEHLWEIPFLFMK